MLFHSMLKRSNKMDYRRFVALHERKFQSDMDFLRHEIASKWTDSGADMGELWQRCRALSDAMRNFKRMSKELYKNYCKDTYSFEIRKETRR